VAASTDRQHIDTHIADVFELFNNRPAPLFATSAENTEKRIVKDHTNTKHTNR